MDKRSIIFVIALTIALFLVNMWFGSKPNEKKPQAAPPPRQEVVQQKPERPTENVAAPSTKEEKFYVLENAYQQLVFSNIGGSLAEINLPLQSDENPKSVIREIRFDRVMQKDYPNNDYFPAFPYQTVDPSKPSSVISVPKGHLGGYYPLLRRSVIGAANRIDFQSSPRFYGLNVIDTYDTPTTIYQLKRLEKDLIEFESSSSQRRITKTFSFAKDPDAAPYCIDVSIQVEGDGRGLYLTSGIPEVELISGSFTPSLKYRITRKEKSQVEQIDLPKTTTNISSIYPNWVCNSNGFLGLIIDPITEAGPGLVASTIPGEQDPTRLTVIDAAYDLYPASKYPGYEVQLPVRASNQTAEFRVYAGPFENATLKKVDAYYSNPAKGYFPDYTASQSFHGWFAFISEPFAKFLFILMKFFYMVTSSWGISIILLTAALRIMLYPLNAWSIKSTSKMQQVAPQVSAIQEKYKKDPKRAQMEIMTLYREKGINPLTGCFPILIQMPFLIGMFDLLKSTFELRGAGFIPGWIDNLTAPDVVFSWSYPIIFFGTSFHLLPILLGVVMYMQQKYSSPLPKDKNLLTDQQKQQRFMGNIMAIVFTVMFYHFPSGLNIYWLSSMLLGILQQWYMTKKFPKTAIVKKK